MAASCKILCTGAIAGVLLAGSASAATLTVTPDKSTYLVGETITVSVFGDSEGELDIAIQGRILFDPGLAQFVSASQDPLTWTVGDITIPWLQIALSSGSGFADAFDQLSPVSNPAPTDVPLTATVTLLATTPGVLGYSWETDDPIERLRFFGLTNAPGGSVTIVPEPGTALLVALGLLAIAAAKRS